MSSPSSASVPFSPAPKRFFKTPEGRYDQIHEKTYPASALHCTHSKSVSQLTIACLKEKPMAEQSQAAPLASNSGSRSVASRFLGVANGGRSLSLVVGNGIGRVALANCRTAGFDEEAVESSTSTELPNYGGGGTFLIYNVADTLFVSDLNLKEKDPIKAIQFSNSSPVCHAFDAEADDGYDLLLGLHCGDVYLVSLRQQLQDTGRKMVAAQHYFYYNMDGATNNSRCICVAWVPGRIGTFVVGHADGNIYVYEKNKEGTSDSSFPVIKDQTQFSISHTRSSKSNPVARWHVCHGPVNSISFSADGACMATVGRDGCLRVFDFAKELLLFGGKSYYGALLCSAWSSDGKYILTGGEDDLVQIWSTEEQKIVAWGEGHNSWISGVAFDSYLQAPNSEEAEQNVVYRFGSVGQDSQLLLWDLAIDELVVPLYGPPGGSPTTKSDLSANGDSISTTGAILPSPSMSDVPKISPIATQQVHLDPLSGLIFTKASLLTVSREGHIKFWRRPGHSDPLKCLSAKNPSFCSSIARVELQKECL
ncbi:probable catabolite repression protein creC isoform X1 [Zingiber officinale]|uniref:probable catabolite repression protein creC isoform X1 n=2 Tax=Zingiber officinale TaxID=94328 RepID=UPI001C4CFC30|nr:probable catabolite repression protein creC isoform X1 [Zingiber officinale]